MAKQMITCSCGHPIPLYTFCQQPGQDPAVDWLARNAVCRLCWVYQPRWPAAYIELCPDGVVTISVGGATEIVNQLQKRGYWFHWPSCYWTIDIPLERFPEEYHALLRLGVLPHPVSYRMLERINARLEASTPA